MTDPVLRTTYRRAADGVLAHTRYEGAPPLSEALIYRRTAEDYIEEQWDGDTLVRYRTIRLGADEPCENCLNGRTDLARTYETGDTE